MRRRERLWLTAGRITAAAALAAYLTGLAQ